MFKIESYKRGIIFSTVFNVFNKGLVFLNGIVVAYFFGAGEGTDLFFYTYNSLVILAAFTMNMNSSVIIPESMRIRAEEGKDKAMAFLNYFILLYSAILVCILLLILIDPVNFFSIVSNFKTDQLYKHKILLLLSLPLFGFSCIITLLVDILTSNKFFTISMIVGIINGLFSLLFVFAMHNVAGIKSVFNGFIISYSLNLILLIFLLKKYLGWKFLHINTQIQRRIWKNLGFAQISNLASLFSLYTPIYILSGFNAGIITALTFAQQIASLPNALITTQFSSVAAIKLNELYSETRYNDINNVFKNTSDYLHFILIPVSCIFFIYPHHIVHIVLGFTSIDKNIADHVSYFIKYLGLLLPFYVTNTLVARLFMASHKIKEAFWYQLIFNVIQIIMIYFAVKVFGISGYPISLIIIYVSNTLIYYYVQKIFFNFIDYQKILENLIVFVVVNILIAAAINFVISRSGLSSSLLVLTCAFTLQILLLLISNHFFRMNKMVALQVENFSDRLKQYTHRSIKMLC